MFKMQLTFHVSQVSGRVVEGALLHGGLLHVGADHSNAQEESAILSTKIHFFNFTFVLTLRIYHLNI